MNAIKRNAISVDTYVARLLVSLISVATLASSVQLLTQVSPNWKSELGDLFLVRVHAMIILVKYRFEDF